MLPFRKILYPVDYSAPCQAIIPYVSEMQKRFSTELSLVHAYGAEALAYSSLPITDLHLPEQARSIMEERLREFAHANFPGVKVDVFIEVGEPGAVIDNVVRHQGADLVITNQTHAAMQAAFSHAGFQRGPSNYILGLSKAIAEKVRAGRGEAAIHITRGDGDGRMHL